MKDLSNGLASHQRLALPVRSESDSAVADQARPYPFSSMPQSRSAPSSVAAPGPAHHEVKLESPAPIPSDDDKEGQALAELAHLVRLQTDLDQTHLQAQVRLHRETVSFALASRLLRCGQTLHRTMIDNLRSDDKKTFGSLYNAFQDVRNSCQATRRHASLDPAMNSEPSMKPLSGTGDFMHTLPPRVSDQLLHFLEKVRSSPNYLADRIASLSTSELSALTTSYRTSSPVASVMPQPNRGKGPNPWNLHHSGQDQVPAAKLLSFERHDPLSSLLYTIYPRGGRRDDAEELRRTDVWATTCARLFVEGIPGGDEVILTVLDAWADLREWPGKARLELLLSQALQDGAFLLDGSEGHAAHVKAQTLLAGTGSSTAVAERFFSKMVVDLLELMKTQQAGIGLPEGLLEIGQAILQKLDGQREEQAARTLIICNWLFSRFLPEVLVKPELLTLHKTLGLMTGQHISEQARRKILGEIAARIQKHVWDVTLEW
ncbi:MAG: hypothetical protein M1817_000505 [Caeruleum heppii]|nr:MAG: hypothetical protein M1817_000505 [Caeruleum heppii]